MKANPTEFKAAEQVLYDEYGLDWYADMKNVELKLTGRIYIHPVTKLRIDLYPDGTTDLTGQLKPGWTIPMLDEAKKMLMTHLEMVKLLSDTHVDSITVTDTQFSWKKVKQPKRVYKRSSLEVV